MCPRLRYPTSLLQAWRVWQNYSRTYPKQFMTKFKVVWISTNACIQQVSVRVLRRLHPYLQSEQAWLTSCTVPFNSKIQSGKTLALKCSACHHLSLKPGTKWHFYHTLDARLLPVTGPAVWNETLLICSVLLTPTPAAALSPKASKASCSSEWNSNTFITSSHRVSGKTPNCTRMKLYLSEGLALNIK